MMVRETREKRSRMLNWKPTALLSHIVMVSYCTSVGYGTSIWNTEEDLTIFLSSKNHVLGMDLEGRSKLRLDNDTYDAKVNVITRRVYTCVCVGQC